MSGVEYLSIGCPYVYTQVCRQGVFITAISQYPVKDHSYVLAWPTEHNSVAVFLVWCFCVVLVDCGAHGAGCTVDMVRCGGGMAGVFTGTHV